MTPLCILGRLLGAGFENGCSGTGSEKNCVKALSKRSWERIVGNSWSLRQSCHIENWLRVAGQLCGKCLRSWQWERKHPWLEWPQQNKLMTAWIIAPAQREQLTYVVESSCQWNDLCFSVEILLSVLCSLPCFSKSDILVSYASIIHTLLENILYSIQSAFESNLKKKCIRIWLEGSVFSSLWIVDSLLEHVHFQYNCG